MKHLLKCKGCKTYTMKEVCPSCGVEAITVIPPKYSPLDKYGKYRRTVKSDSLKKADLL